MDDQTSLTTSSEPEDCVDYIKRCKSCEDIYRDRATGDDAGYTEYIEEIEEYLEDAGSD